MTQIKHIGISFILVTLFALLGCDDPSETPIRPTTPLGGEGTPSGNQIGGDTTEPEGSGLPSANLNLAGTGSGAGGAYDDYAHIQIKQAQAFLVRIFTGMSESHFKDFPEPYNNRETLIDLFENKIEHLDETPKRDGQALLFDYDEDEGKLFYTNRFVEQYGVGKFKKAALKNLAEIEEVSGLILHEFSHLLKIGQSAQTNVKSSIFSTVFMNSVLSEKHLCSGITTTVSGDELEISFALNPATGVSYFMPETNVLDSMNFDKIDEKLNAKGLNSLGSTIGIFDRENEQTASQILQNMFFDTDKEDFVLVGSAQGIDEMLSGDREPQLEYITWGKIRSPLDFSYNYTTSFLDSSEEGSKQVHEDGEISFLLEEPNPSELTSAKMDVNVTENEIPRVLPQQPKIDLLCRNVSNYFTIEEIQAIDVSLEGSAFDQKVNELLSKLGFRWIYRYQNCDTEEEISDEQERSVRDLMCGSLKTKI